MTIYKYPIVVTDLQRIAMPINAEILCVQMQNRTPFIWAIVEENEATKEERSIEVVGTGNFMENRQRTYIGTVQDCGFVWHVFERETEPNAEK